MNNIIIININDYNSLLVLIFFSILIGLFLFSLSYFGVIKNIELEKNSVYECGFEPFADIRTEFDVRFYLVGILFVIFDLEIMFLIPWVVILHELDIFGIISMLLFLIILAIIYIYEWFLGVLTW